MDTASACQEFLSHRPAALAYCRRHGITAVTGACPFMYLPDAALVHRAHRWGRQVLGRPRATSARTAGPS